MGVALGDRAGVALDGARDLELIVELAVDIEFERGTDRENRVDVSEGVFDDAFGGISNRLWRLFRCKPNELARTRQNLPVKIPRQIPVRQRVQMSRQ